MITAYIKGKELMLFNAFEMFNSILIEVIVEWERMLCHSRYLMLHLPYLNFFN